MSIPIKFSELHSIFPIEKTTIQREKVFDNLLDRDVEIKGIVSDIDSGKVHLIEPEAEIEFDKEKFYELLQNFSKKDKVIITARFRAIFSLRSNYFYFTLRSIQKSI